MIDLLAKSGSVLLISLVQLFSGCIAGSLAVTLLRRSKPSGGSPAAFRELLLIAVFAAVGMLLPLGTFGLVAFAAGLVAAGFRIHSLIPMFVSSMLFNIAIPFTDPSFSWRTGFLRLIFAFAAGCMAGVLLMIPKLKFERLLVPASYALPSEGGLPKRLRQALPDAIRYFGMYLVIGAVADTLFRQYFLYSFPGWIFGTSYGKELPVIMSRFGITNPFFSFAIRIFYILADLTNAAAILSYFRIKGLLYIYGFLAACMILLGLSVFL